MFHTFARLLQKHRDAIINSFIMVEKIGAGNLQYESRLSNGPIESLNRKAKDLKRQGTDTETSVILETDFCLQREPMHH